MGLRTSVYLSDELAAMWRASGLRLGEVIRRGLEAAGPVDEVTHRRILREELAGLNVACSGTAQPGYGARGYDRGDYGSEPFEDIP